MASASARDADQGDRPRDHSTSMARSSRSIPDDRNRPLSLVSTYTPQIIAAARNRQRSLAIEILGPNHNLVFPSPGPSEVDAQDVARLSSVSELSEQPVGSSQNITPQPLPSPLAAHPPGSPSALPNFGNSIETNISSPVAIADSLGFTLEGQERESSPSMKGTKLPRARVSMFVEDLEGMIGDSKRPTPSGKINESDNSTTKWPTRTTAVSRTPENQVDESSAISPSETPSTFSEPRKRAVSLATVRNPQARKGSPMNLLPKFLRAKSPESTKIEPAISVIRNKETIGEEKPVEPEEQSPHEQAVSPQSFFDDESSDSGEESQIENAQQAMIASPVMVKHGSATKVGLKEMLRSTPPAEDELTGDQTVKLPEEDSDARKERIYEHAVAAASKDGTLGTGLWKEINPFAPTTYKSEPSRPRPTPSPRPKASRKVSFPLPAPLDVQPGHLFLRQSIVSTPYPSDSDEQRQKRKHPIPGTKPQRQSQTDMALEVVLTLVISSHNNTTPKTKRIVIPTNTQQATLIDSNEKKATPSKATPTTASFDDEKLFKLIRREYTNMRGGTFRRLLSARTVRSINIQYYTSTSELLPHQATSIFSFPENQNQNPIAQTPLSLFRNPKRGRSHHIYTNLIHSHPPSTSSSPVPSHLALTLTTSLSPTALLLCLLATLLLSITTTILWIFLGASPQRHDTIALENAFGVIAPVERGGGGRGGGYRGTAERVGSGGVLGLLVLGLGWTGVGGWLVVSWLVG